MAYEEIANGETGLSARNKINGIGEKLDSHTLSTGSDVHGLGSVSTQSASALSLTNLLTISGSISATGYITGKKVGVFAYLPTSASTGVVEAGVYYPIQGAFENNPIECFELTSSPAIKYTNHLSQFMKVDMFACVYCVSNNSTVTLGIKKSGSVVEGCSVGVFCKTAGEHYTVSGFCVLELETNDEVQLVVTSDIAQTITFHNFGASINQFFN